MRKLLGLLCFAALMGCFKEDVTWSKGASVYIYPKTDEMVFYGCTGNGTVIGYKHDNRPIWSTVTYVVEVACNAGPRYIKVEPWRMVEL